MELPPPLEKPELDFGAFGTWTKKHHDTSVYSTDQGHNTLAIKYELGRTEVEMLEQCAHPLIVPVWFVSPKCMVMPWLATLTDLATASRNGDTVCGSYVRHLMCDVYTALDFMHGKGIVHADVKVQNILYRWTLGTPLPVPRAVLADFDCAFPAKEHGNSAPGKKYPYLCFTTQAFASEEARENYNNYDNGRPWRHNLCNPFANDMYGACVSFLLFYLRDFPWAPNLDIDYKWKWAERGSAELLNGKIPDWLNEFACAHIFVPDEKRISAADALARLRS